MESNLHVLTQFWASVKHLENPSSDKTEQSRQFAHQFIELPFPVFREEGIKSQLSMLPVVLKNDEEVKRVFRLYESIDKLGAIRAQLAEFDRVERELGSPGDIRALTGPHPFYEHAPDLWGECEKLVTELLQDGDPL